MVLQKMSIEGAYQEAIQDAASIIHAASLPTQPSNTHNTSAWRSHSHKESLLCGADNTKLFRGDQGEISSSLFAINDNSSADENSTAIRDRDHRRDFSTTDNSTYDDGIESNITFLEQKQRILRKALIPGRREKAYIANNALDIARGREPYFSRTRNPSIWTEARAIMDQHKLEEGLAPDMVPCSTNDTEAKRSTHYACTRALSSSSPPTSPSSLCKAVVHKPHIPTKKRPKIDLSMVQCISSEKFAEEEHSGMEASNASIGEETMSPNANCRNKNRHASCVSPTTRYQQASELQAATNSRHWISPPVLNQILTLTNAAVTKHHQFTPSEENATEVQSNIAYNINVVL